MTNEFGKAKGIVLAVLIALYGIAGSSGASPLKEKKMPGSMWTLTNEQLRTAQAKITYLGVQSKPVPTVTFGIAGQAVVMARFLEVQLSQQPYDNDEMPYTKSFPVSVNEFQRMLAAAKPILVQLDTGRADFLSFCVVSGSGDEIVGKEFFIPSSRGESFYRALLGAVSPITMRQRRS